MDRLTDDRRGVYPEFLNSPSPFLHQNLVGRGRDSFASLQHSEAAPSMKDRKQEGFPFQFLRRVARDRRVLLYAPGHQCRRLGRLYGLDRRGEVWEW